LALCGERHHVQLGRAPLQIGAGFIRRGRAGHQASAADVNGSGRGRAERSDQQRSYDNGNL
jgi:hypothetical protein